MGGTPGIPKIKVNGLNLRFCSVYVHMNIHKWANCHLVTHMVK